MSTTATPATGDTRPSLDGNNSLRLSLEGALNASIRDQKDRWHRGERVPLETYLAAHPSLANPAECVDFIYAEVLLRESLGDRPEHAEYCFRFPHLADRIRSLFQIHRLLLDGPMNFIVPAEKADNATGASDESPPSATKPALDLPGFDVLEVVGRGGMAIVYKARHLRMSRVVAIKMLHGELHGDSESRLLKEAEAIARVQHPNIVQVFEIGTHQGTPFLILEFVDGGTLADHLRTGPMRPAMAAKLVQTVAAAVHHFHTLGVIHRDLKPRNILLQKMEVSEGQAEQLFPKVTDFGLAKHLDQTGLSRTGELIGTPSYMSPEQAAGQKQVGPASDVYSLGAILYECLTGRPPFQGDTLLAIMSQIAHVDPVPVSRIRHGIPIDLETVCLKCLSKSPKSRYASAQHLAEDLERFLNGKPTLARPLSMFGRTFKLVRRYPLVAALIGLVGISLLAGFVGISLQWQKAVEARNDLQGALKDVDVQRSKAELNVYHSRVAQSVLLWDAGDAEQARELLASCEPAPGRPDLRGWEWHYLRRVFHPELLTRRFDFWVNDLGRLPSSGPDAFALAVGKPLIVPTYKPVAEDGQVWSMSLTEPPSFVRESAPLSGGTVAVAVQPNGSLVAWGASNGQIVVMDRTTQTPVRTLDAGSTISCLRFTPDGRHLVAGTNEIGLVAFDPVTGNRVATLDHVPKNCQFAINPAGTLLVCGGYQEKLFFFELPSWKPVGDPVNHPGQSATLAFSPDGATLASGGQKGTISLWDPVARKELRRLDDHSGPIYAIAFHPNGRLMATGGADRAVRIWDTGLTKPIRTYWGHSSAVRTLIFERNGNRLASGAQDQTLRLWDANQDPRGMLLPFHVDLNAITCNETPNGLTIRADSLKAGVRSWLVPNGTVSGRIELPEQGRELYPVRYADFLNGGRVLASVTHAATRELAFVDAETGQAVRPPLVAAAAIQTVGADRTGRWLVWAEETSENVRTIRWMDWDTQQEFGPIAVAARRVRAVNFDSVNFDSTQGRIVVVYHLPLPSQEIVLSVFEGGKERELCRAPVMIGASAFSPRGDLFAADVGQMIHIYRTDTWELLHQVPSSGNTTGIAFTPDGLRMAAVGYDGVVSLCDPSAGIRILRLRGLASNRPNDVACNARVAFSPDGNWLISTNWDGSLNVWNASPINPTSP